MTDEEDGHPQHSPVRSLVDEVNLCGIAKKAQIRRDTQGTNFADN